MPGADRRSARAATLVGLAVSFVASVNLMRAVRLALLLDPEPSWALARFLLSLFLICVGVAAGGVAAAGFLLWSRTAGAVAPLEPLPFSPRALLLLTGAAIVAGGLFRFALLDRLPSSLWEDDVSLIAPTLALQGSASDFSDSIRPVMYGTSSPFGTVGVLYLEFYRVVLNAFGITVFGIRFVSAIAGVLSLFTAAWLGHALLPRGGGTLVALILAGLRWHLILSRWGWNMIVLAPIVDVAAVLILRSRRRNALLPAAAAGIAMGAGAHVYLAAWIAAAALFGLAVWPGDALPGGAARARLAAVYLCGFLAAAAPLFLLHQGRVFPYFRRVGHHNVAMEIRLWKSWIPPFAAAADAMVAPWLLSDPIARHDQPGRSRLGLFLGTAMAIALARALLCWREEISGFLVVHFAAGFAGMVAGGQYGLPNGSRFGYLSDVSAVAAACGVLWILARAPAGLRRAAAILAVGGLAVLALLGARDAVLRWSTARTTFDSFSGQDTLIGRTAVGWERFGSVEVEPGLGHSPEEVSGGTIRSVRHFRLDPEEPRWQKMYGGAVRAARSFRIVGPTRARDSGERVVDAVQDDWGRQWAVVLGRRASPSAVPGQR